VKKIDDQIYQNRDIGGFEVKENEPSYNVSREIDVFFSDHYRIYYYYIFVVMILKMWMDVFIMPLGTQTECTRIPYYTYLL
jgi:hypothetical protein